MKNRDSHELTIDDWAEKIKEYVEEAKKWVSVEEIANAFNVSRHKNLVASSKISTIAHIINNKLKKYGFHTCRVNYYKNYQIWVAAENITEEEMPEDAFKGAVTYKFGKKAEQPVKTKSNTKKAKQTQEKQEVNVEEKVEEVKQHKVVSKNDTPKFVSTPINVSSSSMNVQTSAEPITSEGYRKFTANYSYSNPNFVIQNLDGEYKDSIFYPTICVLKNIIQRGVPTLMSKFLQDEIGVIQKREDYNQSYPLIDNQVPNWQWTIKGLDEKDYYPAKDFFYKAIPEDFKDCLFIQNLLVPEASILDIVQDHSGRAKNFVNQNVDFYLPQARLVIEIDGSQHNEKLQKAKDNERDLFLTQHKVETIRITTDELFAKKQSYKDKVKRIKSKLSILFYEQKKRNKSTEIKINEYKEHYINGTDLTNPNYLATAIIRFQILILELLATEQLTFEKAWNLEINCQDIQGFVDLAIDDLFNWFNHLFKLRNIDVERPTININYVANNNDFSIGESIKIDFSLLKRYTDENIVNPHIIYVRTDYFDNYNYFKVATTELIDYPENVIQYNDSLLYIAWNLFLQNYDNLKFETTSFREGQLEIITNALQRRHTIGLLPTGSGKSICYQMASMLQPAISFVVCPIKSLMIDQAVDLEKAQISRVQSLTSDNTTEEKDYIQKEFKKGKYFFIFISPERFQIQKFREYLVEINSTLNIAYAIIDEAHCLSEWGHDFRTSYLNLVNAINRYCKNFSFIALTATASSNVLKDLKLELQIKKDDDIKTPAKYSREELAFTVEEVSSFQKVNRLEEILSNYSTSDFFGDKCGVVFTATVNGQKGCYYLSNKLSEDLHKEINFYSGSKPDDFIGGEDLYAKYKQKVQNDFKDSEASVLVTTKAFGMGVNKGNIGYTVHYGVPASMESFYQEAGRAGRAKNLYKDNKAECIVLLSKEKMAKTELDKLWEKDITLENIRDVSKSLREDIRTQMFFLTLSEKDIETELVSLQMFYDYINKENKKEVLITNARDFGNNIEKTIFKLKQLGIITDWTVAFLGNETRHYLLEIGDLNIDSIKNCVEQTIKKYDSEFSFESLNKPDNNYPKLAPLYNGVEESFEKYAQILLQWHFDKFFYSRRQSLKNVYETCVSVADGEITDDEFKQNIENYFRFSNKSHIMQVIADSPLESVTKWFDVLLVFEDSVKTEQTIEPSEAKGLISNLSRFLESYQQNTGLDFISGLLRLIVNDFNNIDGRKRFESSLNQIKQYYDETTKDCIFKNLFLMVKRMKFSKDKKNELAKSIANVFDNKKAVLYDLYNNLEDDYSFKEICADYLTRIKEIKAKIEVNNERN